MDKIGIYSVSDRYIAFLRSDENLKNVFDNKECSRTHIRKYLGIVFLYNNFNYYVPFSSPKNSDYIIHPDGKKEIRKSIIPIVRMITNDTVTGQTELKGTLKFSNMIPVPSSELTPYKFADETDSHYKTVIQKDFHNSRYYYLTPIPNRLTAEKIARTEARVILELTPTP